MNNEFVFKLSGDPADLLKALKDVQKKIKDIGDDVGDNLIPPSAGKGFDSLISKFKEGQATASAGGGIFGSLAGTLGQLASPAGAATAAIGALTAGFAATLNIGKEFEQNLAGVSAVTGLSGDALNDLGERARQLAKDFGTSATDQLKSFQGVLSKFGADLAKTPESLQKVSENINTLAKAGGLDAAQSMDTLANAMLQFGVNVSDGKVAAAESTRFMNVLAASARVGAAEIPQVGEAVLVAGVAAKQANVSFEETNAAIQVLAQGGKVGAEAGTALRNVLGKLAGEDVVPKEAAAKLKKLGVNFKVLSNNSLPLEVRLKELAKAQKDATVFAQVFGTENAAAANILASGADTIKDWTAQITGTNDATVQAKTNMNTLSGAMDRLRAIGEDALLGLYKAISPALTGMANGIASFFTSGNEFGDAFKKTWASIYNVLKPIVDFVAKYFLLQFKVGLEELKTIWRVSFDVISTTITNLGAAIQPLIDTITGLFDTVGNGESAFETFKNVLSEVGGVIGSALKVSLGIIVKYIGFVVQAMVWQINKGIELITWVKDSVVQIYKWATSFEFVQSAIKAVSGFIDTLIEKATGAYNIIAKFLNLKGEPEAINQEAKASKERALATQEAIKKQLELNRQTQDSLLQTKGLIESFKQLAEKKKLTAEESRKLQEVLAKLDHQYPNLIKQNGTLKENLKGVADVGDQVQKSLDDIAAKNQKLSSQFTSAQQAINFADSEQSFTNLTEFVNKRATDKMGDDIAKLIATFGKEMGNAKNAPEVLKAQANFGEAFEKLNVGEKDSKLYSKVVDSIGEIVEQRITALDAFTKKAEEKVAKTEQKQIKEAAKAGQEKKTVFEQTKKTFEDEKQAILNNVKALEEKYKAEAVAAGRSEITDEQKKELLQFEADKLREIASLAKERFTGIKLVADKNETQADIDKILEDTRLAVVNKGLEINRQLMSNSKDAIQNSMDSIKVAYDVLVHQFASKAVTLEGFENGVAELKKKIQDNLAANEIAFKIAPNADVQKTLAKSTADLTKQLEEIQKDEDKRRIESVKLRREAELAAITDVAEREIQIKTDALNEQRDKELSNIYLSAQARLNINNKYDEEINKLRAKSVSGYEDSYISAVRSVSKFYKDKYKDISSYITSLLGKSASDYANDSIKAVNKITDAYSEQLGLLTAQNEERKKANEEALKGDNSEKELLTLKKKLAKQSITFQEYNDQVAEITSKRATDIQQVETDSALQLQAIQQTASREGVNVLMQGIAAQTRAISDFTANALLTEIQKNEKLNELRTEQAAIEAVALTERTAQQKDRLARLGEEIQNVGATSTDVLSNIGTQAAASFGAMIVAGKSASDALKQVAIGVVKDLIALYVAPIFASFFSFLGPFALPAAGAAIALINQLLSSAISSFAGGVVDYQGAGTGTSDSNLVRISRGESVMRTDITRRERPLLDYLHAGGSSQEFFRKQYATVAPNGELQYQTLAQLSQVNRRLERVEEAIVYSGSLRNVNMTVEHDESLIFKSRDRFTRISNARS